MSRMRRNVQEYNRTPTDSELVDFYKCYQGLYKLQGLSKLVIVLTNQQVNYNQDDNTLSTK